MRNGDEVPEGDFLWWCFLSFIAALYCYDSRKGRLVVGLANIACDS